MTNEKILEDAKKDSSNPVDREDWLRISKSGCSIKLGWSEKRIVASVPNCLVTNCTEQWLDDAERLCNGWNELPIAKAHITELEAELSKARADASNKAKFDCAYEVLNQIASKKRNTQEKRLANACILFLDSIPLLPNAQQPMKVSEEIINQQEKQK